jgi:hypothetical protein
MQTFFLRSGIIRLLMYLADHPIIAITGAVIAIAAFMFWLLRSDIN